MNNPGWNEDARSTWIWGYGFLGLVRPSHLQYTPGGIADGYSYFWKPIADSSYVAMTGTMLYKLRYDVE